MTQLELARRVKDHIAGSTYIESKLYVKTTLDLLKEALLNGEEITVIEFAKFGLRKQKGALRRNLMTGEMFKTEDRMAPYVRFRPKYVKAVAEANKNSDRLKED